MSQLKKIPVIDLFAGPGGLGEGFSSIIRRNKRVFDIKVSIEKDEYAHQTLELRSFTRQFEPGQIPVEYYDLVKETNLIKRTILRKALFSKYPVQSEHAKKEAWRAELGNPAFPSSVIDDRISSELKGAKNWVLIGGPPCQAYSVVGRSRVGGIGEKDHRVFLYKEYLRIIAVHHPAVFVMENVKGLLSAKLNGERIFDWILDDLRNPSVAFPGLDSPKYRVFSLSTEPDYLDGNNNPIYQRDMDYLIKSEEHGIPQKRHRVILLGIREDIGSIPGILKKQNDQVKLKDVIGDLPILRSGISRSYQGCETIDGKKKRYYTNEKDSDERWSYLMSKFQQEIISWNGFAKDYGRRSISLPAAGTGNEYIPFSTPSPSNPLSNWYKDEKLKGVCNHESRAHLVEDLKRYLFSSIFTETYGRFPRLHEYDTHSNELLPDHENARSGKFGDRFRVQLPDIPATTVTSHISKDGHYFIHYDPKQCRSLTVREAARIQTFPDNYLFCGPRTAQFHQVGNAVPPYLAKQIGEIVLKLLK